MLSAKRLRGLYFLEFAKTSQICKSTGLSPDQGRASSTYKILSFVVKAQGDLLGLVDDENLEARDFVIRAEEFGIPQARHRVILLGVRSDVSGDTIETLIAQSEKATVKNAIGDLPVLRSGISKGPDELEVWAKVPLQTVGKLSDYRSQLPSSVVEAIFDSSHKTDPPTSRGTEFGQRTLYEGMPERFKDWFIDPRMNGYITNHSTRGHIIEDLARYWFASNYRAVEKKSPKATDFPKALWPAHANFTSGKFADRFRVQGFDSPASTVTSHISKDGHYFIHPDPSQMRSLTVREAARIQTFPDNYHFVGSRTEQYVQVGNAVPPLLALQLAEVVIQELFCSLYLKNS